MSQSHSKFKLFTRAFTSPTSISDLGKDIESWVAKAKVAPKSIGVEYLEESKDLVVSIGYSDDQPAYNVTIRSELIGKFDPKGDLSKLEEKLGAVADGLKNVICHELTITETKDLYAILMIKA